jgi:hypothetical protein
MNLKFNCILSVVVNGNCGFGYKSCDVSSFLWTELGILIKGVKSYVVIFACTLLSCCKMQSYTIHIEIQLVDKKIVNNRRNEIHLLWDVFEITGYRYNNAA